MGGREAETRFAGMGPPGHRIFFTPAYINQKLPPGKTPIPQDEKWYQTYMTGSFLLFSPNTVWLLITIAVYFIFPYRMNEPVSWRLVAERGMINTALVLFWFGFWHITLFWLGFGTRPFVPNRTYRVGKLLHNVFYSVLGALMWTGLECAILHVYISGKRPFISDAQALSSFWNAVSVFVWVHLGVVVRDVHFYLAHRFIHVRFLYRFIHSVHHRNTDIEPFSGLCMHPVEHLLYFSVAVIPLYLFPTSPFAMQWIGIHALLAPAASHSGWEDNWQSDLYHYLHHRYTSCNFGTAGLPFDRWSGTVRNVIGNDKVDATDEKARLGLPQSIEFVYMFSFFLILCAFVSACCGGLPGVPAQVLAAAVALGPLILSGALHMPSWRQNEKGKGKGVGASLASHLLMPFHQDSAAKLLLHLGAAGVFVIVPIYDLALWTLQ
uniref:Fatty acid hydroxylase domain-containing protein n=1 Tax=Chromera velia CCMP2878 TaxID=1169474 RepID=A0A0G4FJ67_9ALVE|eukprot:Cvel_17249.t1-p1 / transcript=Cvel_17249.t1 / gene=Cvel_17249 / organism=Chromera_velia_CCMP2878 / gene_product=Putative Delta(7)-sterol-C5(6)-desaturase 2, putative / transcript_product=Putative Delta(7)-sterol-C5(6)-desaturase 2, putative / location=Cvel_scaffold1366:23938-25242(-) / protein_length=435 / sequence_SO=supercontig / SO=protein_coding / is_pseudo=false